jgi:hypothetical protein
MFGVVYAVTRYDDFLISSFYAVSPLSLALVVPDMEATTNQKVTYGDGRQTAKAFHGMPDGASCFPDERSTNPGGWIYASNSEMPDTGEGGVGALTLDANGNLMEYQMLLQGTTMNW